MASMKKRLPGSVMDTDNGLGSHKSSNVAGAPRGRPMAGNTTNASPKSAAAVKRVGRSQGTSQRGGFTG